MLDRIATIFGFLIGASLIVFGITWPAHLSNFYVYQITQYEDTIDDDILANVQAKARNMSHVIDQAYAIYSLDMFAEDEELEAYERLFAHSH